LHFIVSITTLRRIRRGWSSHLENIRKRVLAIAIGFGVTGLATTIGTAAMAQELKQAVQLSIPAAMPPLVPTSKLSLKSSAAVVFDQSTGEILYGKNSQAIHPIASISKLMTAIVVFDAQLDPAEIIQVTDEDVDYLRNTGSRLHVGAALSRDEMLRLALMASENRAAAALSRAYPGGREAFIRAMNAKAQSLGLIGTRFADSTGLSSTNVSTAEDLAALVAHAHTYAKIREYSTARQHDTEVAGRKLAFRNTNGLVSSADWGIGLSKTGFINEAGRCLVMQAQLAGRAVIIVLLDSWGKNTRSADALRVRQWLEAAAGYKIPHTGPRSAPRKAVAPKVATQKVQPGKAMSQRAAGPASQRAAVQKPRRDMSVSRPQERAI
jgi:D-alanyl-D-alanine endopeptidase (penicillin-binding protein 7)